MIMIQFELACCQINREDEDEDERVGLELESELELKPQLVNCVGE